MKGVFAAVLLVASAAWGQQSVIRCSSSSDPAQGSYWFEGGAVCHSLPKDRVPISHAQTSTRTAPLKCGKYQHLDMAPIWCGDSYPSTCHPPQCADDLHIVTEREWQDLMDEIKWERQIREQQCPSLSWVGGRCLPFCDEINGTGSCAYRPGQKAGK